MSRDILERLDDPELVALRLRGDEWPRAVFSPTLVPDTWMGLVQKPDGQRRFVPSGEEPQVERLDRLVLVRNRKFTVPVEMREAVAADRHVVQARVELLVRWPMREDDLAGIQTILTGNELSVGALTAAVARAGAHAALGKFIAARPSAELVHQDQRGPLLEHFRDGLKRFLFSAGLELPELGAVELRSSTLEQAEKREQQRTARMREIEERTVVETAALAATRRRLEGLGDILAKLKTASESGSQRWHELLPVLTPGERGRLLENLWRLTPDQEVAEAIVLVAGLELVRLDPQNPSEPTLRVGLPDRLGGLRSVTYDRESDSLLVGAATGLWHVRAADFARIGEYAAPNPGTVRTGFNAAAIWQDRVVATHSALGAWSWKRLGGTRSPAGCDRGEDHAEVAAGEQVEPGLPRGAVASPPSPEDENCPQPVLEALAATPRTIRAPRVLAQGLLLIAVDDRIHAVDPEGVALWQTPSAGTAIHDIAIAGNEVFVSTAGGSVLMGMLDQSGGGLPTLAVKAWRSVFRGHGGIESVQVRRWDDLIELVVPAGGDGICGVYPHAGFVARILRTPVPVRRVWASDDAVVALSEQRERLFVLHAESTCAAGVEVPLGRVLGQAAQDGCLVVRRAGGR